MWDELGISPTDDAKVIRRAYAARLKRLDPDRDREAFAQLRRALEWALAAAAARATAAAHPSPGRPRATSARERASATRDLMAADWARHQVRVPAAHPLAGPDDPPLPAGACLRVDRAQDRAVLSEMDAALQRRDARAAAELYFRAAAGGALPLGSTEHMLARLLAVALADPALDPAGFRALARSVGWDRPELDSELVSEVRRRVGARLAAEDFYDEVVAIAERSKPGVSRYGARTGKVMLRRIRGWGLFRINREALAANLDRLEPHAAWLADRIDPAWVATLRRRLRRRELWSAAGTIVILGFLLLNALIVLIGSVVGLIQDRSLVAAVLLVAFTGLFGWLLKLMLQHFRALWRSRT